MIDDNSYVVDRQTERLAGLIERLHQRARTEFWGYSPDEALSNEALIAQQYRGIRPGPGPPRLP